MNDRVQNASSGVIGGACGAQAKQAIDYTVSQALDMRINKLTGELEALQLLRSRIGLLKDVSANDLRKAIGHIGY